MEIGRFIIVHDGMTGNWHYAWGPSDIASVLFKIFNQIVSLITLLFYHAQHIMIEKES